MARLSIIVVLAPFLLQVLSVPVPDQDGSIFNNDFFSSLASEIAASQTGSAEAAVASKVVSDGNFAGTADGVPFGTLSLPAQGEDFPLFVGVDANGKAISSHNANAKTSSSGAQTVKAANVHFEAPSSKRGIDSVFDNMKGNFFGSGSEAKRNERHHSGFPMNIKRERHHFSGIPVNMKRERPRFSGFLMNLEHVNESPKGVDETGVEGFVSENDKREPFFRVDPVHPIGLN